MRVGIVTFHGAENYGSVFQAYALTKFLTELGHETEIINYNFMKNYKQYNYFRLYTCLHIPTLKSDILSFNDHHKRKKNFSDFRKNYLITTSFEIKFNFQLKKCNQYFDAFICGSDQIWNPICIGKKINKCFFLKFADANKLKIAYAVSMGDKALPHKLISKFIKAVERIDYVSFREETTRNMVCNIMPNKDFFVTLDPVLLFPDVFYRDIIKNNAQKKKLDMNRNLCDKIVFIYVIGRISPNLSWISAAVELFKSKKYRIMYSVQDIDTKNPLKNFDNVSGCHPVDFLNYIDQSDVVISNSFHCTAFSIIFNKTFISVEMKDSSNRMRDLLIKLGLQNCLVNTQVTTTMLESIISSIQQKEYLEVNRRLSELQKKSRDFLTNALERKI